MEGMTWLSAVVPGLIAVTLMGLFVWAVFDVIREERLDQTTRAIWVLALFVLPLFGFIAWLYAKSRLGIPERVNLKDSL